MTKANIWILLLVGFVGGYLFGEISHHLGQDSARQQYIEERMQ